MATSHTVRALHAHRARSLLTAVFAVAYPILWPQAVAASTVLKFGYILSTESQLGYGARVFSSEVARRTAGRYAIEEYPNAMLGGEVAMMRDLQVGAIDAAFITGAPLATLVPDAGVFNIPFLFRSVADARALFDGPIGADYLRKFDGTGIVGLAWGENGMRHLTNSKHEVRVPADLVGMKLRIPQSDIMEAGFKALRLDVRQMPFTQVYSALQKGEVDAEENPIATIVASRFGQVQKYLTLTGHIYDPAVILMSSEAFDALSDADKAAFAAAANRAGTASREAATALEKKGIEDLKRHGVAVISSIDEKAFSDAMAPATPYFEKRFGRDLIARIRQFDAAPDAKAPLPKVATP